jgi:hypothetical protein
VSPEVIAAITEQVERQVTEKLKKERKYKNTPCSLVHAD